MINDYHIHSNYSDDGTCTIEEIINLAKQKGLDSIAICDCNTVEGLDELLQNDKGIKGIAGIDIDANYKDIDFVITGLNIDYSDIRYQAIYHYYHEIEQKISNERITLFEEKYNIFFNKMDLMRIENDRIITPYKLFDYIVQSHMFDNEEWLKKYCVNGTKDYTNFYNDNFSFGKDCYVKIKCIGLDDIVDLIHDTKGLAIISNPSSIDDDILEEILLKCDGIEAYSNLHDLKAAQKYVDLALKNNKHISAGSDFISQYNPNNIIGQINYEIDESNIDINK